MKPLEISAFRLHSPRENPGFFGNIELTPIIRLLGVWQAGTLNIPRLLAPEEEKLHRFCHIQFDAPVQKNLIPFHSTQPCLVRRNATHCDTMRRIATHCDEIPG
jgi:hypothetical protein